MTALKTGWGWVAYGTLMFLGGGIAGYVLMRSLLSCTA